MKYAILHGNYNIYHAEFDNYEEAKEYYDELVKDEGTDFDLQLCKILETHEAPEQEDIKMTAGGKHYNIDFGFSKKDLDDYQEYGDSLKSETKALQKIKQLFFGR